MEHQFRNAVFGGFNRQDVLDYLERVAQENTTQVETLRKQLEEAQSQCGQLSGMDLEHTSQLEQLQQENSQLKESTSQLELQLSEARSQVQQLTAQLEQANQERQSLQEQVEKFRFGAEAYDAVKDRAAGVELDAHRRAQGVLEEAHSQAQHIQAQVAQWLDQVEKEYTDLRSQIDATVSHAADELTKTGAMLNEITQRLVQQDGELERLESVCIQSPLDDGTSSEK